MGFRPNRKKGRKGYERNLLSPNTGDVPEHCHDQDFSAIQGNITWGDGNKPYHEEQLNNAVISLNCAGKNYSVEYLRNLMLTDRKQFAQLAREIMDECGVEVSVFINKRG